jgi:hypothetical protein
MSLILVSLILPKILLHITYGGGADDRVERQGRTGDSSLRPWGSVNRIDELRVVPQRCRVLLHALGRLGYRVPPRRTC